MKTRNILIIALVCLVSVLVSMSAFADTLNPVADSHVQNTLPTSNFGTATNLEAKTHATDPTRDGYLKFDIGSVSAIAKATLRVNAKLYVTATSPIGLSAYIVSDTNWSETGITWSNRPALGTFIVNSNIMTTNWAWYEYDVSSYIRTQQISGYSLVSIGLHASNNTKVIYVQTREAVTNKPQLVIVTNNPPSVWIAKPTSGTLLPSPGISLQAYATDTDGSVAAVKFYAGSNLIGTSTNAPFTSFTNASTGSYTLTAVAVDNLGLSSTSAPVYVTVVNPTDLNTNGTPSLVIDANTNGIPDLLEDAVLSAPTPFALSPFIVTGAFEAEQYDAGGFGVGYSNVVSHPTNSYRITEMEIRSSDDRGSGYVLRLKANEWARYTFLVQQPHAYVVSARVKGAVGAKFKFVLGNANSTVDYSTADLTLSGTNWQNIETSLTLPAGTNYLRVVGVTDVNSYVADFNYFSVYPSIASLPFPASTITLGTNGYADWFAGSIGTNFVVAQSNSATLQAAIDATLLAGGGTIYFPTGLYYLAQYPDTSEVPLPYDRLGSTSADTYAVKVIFKGTNGSNIRFAGTTDASTGTNTTMLIAHNRGVTMFNVRSHNWDTSLTEWIRTTGTNIAFENITLIGNPHVKVTSNSPNGIFEPGWYWNMDWSSTNQALQNYAGIYYTNLVAYGADFRGHGVGSLLVFVGNGYNNPGIRDIRITHCDFVNGPCFPVILHSVDNVLLTSNSFRMVNAGFETNISLPVYWKTNGAIADILPNHPLPSNDGMTWDAPTGQLGIFGGVCSNVVVLRNYFDGNPAYDMAITNGQFAAADGIAWFQNGGNWYFGDNDVKHFIVEGIQLNAGPGAVVGGKFASTREANIAALVFDDSHPSLTGNPLDRTFSVVGNSFDGVHVAVSGYGSNSLHFSGNYVSNIPPMNITNIYWAAGDSCPLIGGYSASYVNMSGNFITNSGFALKASPPSGNMFIIGNNFADIHKVDPGLIYPISLYSGQRGGSFGFDYDTGTGTATNIVIARNIIGARETLHLSLNSSDATNVYLFRNAYLDTNAAPVALSIDPTNAPVLRY